MVFRIETLKKNLTDRIEKDRADSLNKIAKIQSKTAELREVVEANDAKLPHYDKEMAQLQLLVKTRLLETTEKMEQLSKKLGDLTTNTDKRLAFINKCLDINEICKLTDEEKEEGKKKPVSNFVEFCTYVYRKPFEKLEEVNFAARQRTEAATQRLDKN